MWIVVNPLSGMHHWAAAVGRHYPHRLLPIRVPRAVATGDTEMPCLGHGHPRAQNRPSSLRVPIVLERTRDSWARPPGHSASILESTPIGQPSDLPRWRVAAPSPIAVLKDHNTNQAKAQVMNSWHDTMSRPAGSWPASRGETEEGFTPLLQESCREPHTPAAPPCPLPLYSTPSLPTQGASSHGEVESREAPLLGTESTLEPKPAALG